MVSDPCSRILKEFPTWSQIEFSGEIHKTKSYHQLYKSMVLLQITMEDLAIQCHLGVIFMMRQIHPGYTQHLLSR